MNDTKCEWISLPSRNGGLGLIHPISYSQIQFSASVSITTPLVTTFLNDSNNSYFTLSNEMKILKDEFKANRKTQLIERVREILTSEQLCLFDSANKQGASVWLTALPLKEHSFELHKGAFRDPLSLRYG